MKRKTLILVWALALTFVPPVLVEARNVHFFQCGDCHRGGFTRTDMADGTLCMSCHDPGAPATTLNDSSSASPVGRYVIGDGSNAMGSNPAPSKQVSHMWGADEDNPLAGAQLPTVNRSKFDGRYGISRGTLACSRCHNPHGSDVDTTILKLDNSSDQMCKDCHLPWATSDPDAYETHPMVADYAAVVTANPTKYKAGVTNVGSGDIRLVAGGVSCTSCHGVHFTDSDSATDDGKEQSKIGNPGYTTGLNTGDGKLLRTDGPTRADTSALCQACHTYKAHGNAGETVGCLVCHSGHSYNGGVPNYFVLRSTAATTTFNTVTGLDYTSLPGVWEDGNSGTANGYCEKCHGNVSTMPGSLRIHSEGETCSTCHVHNASGATYSFEAGGCDECHGYPPSTVNQGGPDGYAYDAAGPYDYSAQGFYKPENATPHSSHSGTGSGYNLSCSLCHNDDFGTTHDQGSFQDVLTGASFDARVDASGALSPGYATSGSGTCSNVACHSNGGRRTSDGPTRQYNSVSVTWANGKGTITTCDACHGNSAATMGLNSAPHIKHLDKGYSCNVCHSATAASTTALASGAIGGVHVNGAVEVSYNSAYSLGAAALGAGTYTSASGTCSIYCHSDGKGTNAAPDWDSAATGACGTCHDTTGASLGGSHPKHVSDVIGPTLSCAECHGTNADTGAHTGHIDGAITKLAASASCDSCHAIDGGESAPVWGNAASADCTTCHTGSATSTIESRLAPAKSKALSTGHNRPTASGTYPVSSNPAANKACTDCHDATVAGHFDGDSLDKRLVTGFDCTSCHTTIITHQLKTCVTCHDPHGDDVNASPNIFMVRANSADYAGTVALYNTTGFDSYDEDDGAAGGAGEVNADDICATCHTVAGGTTHNNSDNSAGDHNQGTDCFTCHKPHTDAAAFGAGAGTACNDCHGNPPATGVHTAHSIVASHDKDLEDRSDCEACHTGAASYTYDVTADQGASLNHSNAAGRVSILATAVGYNSANGTCSGACHSSTAAVDGFWTDANGLGCDACHGNPPVGTNHSKHIGAGLSCGDCHAGVDAPGTSPLTHNDAEDVTTDYNSVLTRGSGYVNTSGLDAEVSDATYNSAVSTWVNSSVTSDAGNTCSNTDCHDPSGGYQVDWDVDTASCALCHSNSDPATGSHTPHLAASVPTTFGKTMACTDCHGDTTAAGTDMAHRDAAVNFEVGVTYNSAVTQTCTTTTCHNDGKAAAVETPQWGRAPSAADNCTVCHGYGPATGRHGVHVANATYVSGGCDDCHAAETAVTHINTAINYNAAVISVYNSVDGGCTNTCHTAAPASYGDWKDAAKLDCSNCHGSAMSLDRGWPPATQPAHAKHTGNTTYVAANCVDCHNDNTVAHSALDNAVSSPTLGAKVSLYNSVAGTCTNTCHGGSADFTDSIPAPVCVDCHSGTYVGTAPASGLHAGPLTVSGNPHDDSFDDGNLGTATCETCHTATPSSAHMTGTLSGAEANFAAAVNETGGATPTCGPNGTLSTCHDDGGVWSRKWSTTAKNSDGTECANCHGDFAQGWVTGIGARHSGDAQLAANHDGTDQCYTCHTYKAGVATYYNAVTQHRDGSIQLNNAMGFVDNGATVGCTNCHAANDGLLDGQHEFQDTEDTDGLGIDRWGRVLQAGPAADCNSCHTGNGRTHGDVTENATLHDEHYNSVLVTGCGDCHSNAGPGSADHNNGTVNFGGPLMNSALIDYSAAAFGDDCTSANGCHDSDVAGDWSGNTLGADACADCHASAGTLGQGGYPPVSNEHTEHINNNTYVSGDCADCHGASADTGAHVTHKDGSVANTVSYNSVTGTCANTCHSVADGNDWTSATGLNCADCHSSAKSLDAGGEADLSTAIGPNAGRHDAHMASTTYVASGCTDCHGHSGGVAAGHLDGPTTADITLASQVSLYNSVDGGCTNACHTVAPATFGDWLDVAKLACADCHGSGKVTTPALDRGWPPATQPAHAKHTGNTSYVTANCVDCHNDNTVAHSVLNNSVTLPTLGAKVSVYNSVAGTCTNTCHGGSADFTDSIPAPVCVDCHSGTYVGTAPASGLHAGVLTVSANPHDDSFDDGNLGTATCETCHTATPSAAHMTGTLAGAEANFAAAVNETGGATPTCGPNGTLAACHDDGGAWVRKWSATAKNADGTECANCHGDFTAGFVGGMGLRHQTATSGDADGDIAANHDGTDQCYTCHTYKAGDATYYNAATLHRDGSIQLNNAIGFVDNGATVGCGNCHTSAGGTADEGHEFADSTVRWTRALQAGPAATCDSCHGYPPITKHAAGATAVNHGFADSGATLLANHNACETCHGTKDSGTSTHAPNANYNVATMHNNGSITVNGPTGTGSGYNAVNFGCDNACHGNDAAHRLTDSAMTPEFGDFGGGDCAGCHGDSGAGSFWPDFASTNSGDWPDRAGLHVEHVDAIGDAINGGGPGSATLADKNASCSYCHPSPGGGGHNNNTTLSPADVADLHKDGWNPSTSYLNMQAGSDPEGLYTPAIKRCSAVDCHSSGEFTWTWYPDVLPPGTVGDLAAAVGSEPGTVDLTWTAPANDGAAGPNSYHNEVRYSTSAITSGALYNSATVAGGAPSVLRRGNSQTMTVAGLTPGATYHFAVKVADEEYNWSTVSNSVSALARADDQAPIFFGLASAAAADEAGTVELSWELAQDHSLPVTYQVWYNVATIDFLAPPQAATEGTSYRVGLPGGILYNFAVRAKDSAATPNTDTNTAVKQALAKTPPKLAYTTVDYYTSGNTALQTGTYGTAGGGSLAPGASRTFVAPAYAVDTNVIGTNFFCRMANGSETTGTQATVELGYMTGAAWNSFTPAITITRPVPPNSNRIQRFGFGDGGMVPAGSSMAVKVTNSGTLAFTDSYGSATDRGDIAVSEQLFNHLPSAVAFSPQPNGSGNVTITWSAATDADTGHTVHYDVYGSDNGGASYDYIIAKDLPAATTSVQWNTVADGIGLAAANLNVQVKVLAGDGYQSGDGSGAVHTETASLPWTVNNTADAIAPAAVTDLLAETRPKMGSIYLTWSAPGDDGNAKTRASEYDIRWSTAPITSDALFNGATTVTDEPAPDFGGTPQGYEVLGLTPGTHYYFAIKTADETPNWSALSNSAEANGGLRCGICHGTPPDDAATAGNHIAHGYTINDCAKCHGPVENYNTVSHQDGKLVFGFGRDASGNRLAAVEATVSGANNEIVTYWQDPDGAGPLPAVKVYEDTNGGGGFNETAWAGSDKVDSGTCFGFTSVNASGCHGPAAPTWDEAATLVCADCHGDNSRVNDLYGNPYDDTGEDVQASPPNDNHGYQGLPTDPIQERRYVGQHEKHLNSSFRFAKGDSCRICHKDNNHADGVIDFAYDYAGAGENAVWTPYNTTTDAPGTCAGTSDLSCHGVNVTPKWDSAESVECNSCHGFGGLAPDHVTDPAGAGFVDDLKGNCEWCHPGGHPRGALAGMVLIPNNVFVGINYASGGIHLYNSIGGRAAAGSEAEICWGCHDSQTPKISEWGTDTGLNNISRPANLDYDYGTLTTANWTTATWTSGTAAFSFKTGAIQSTHTTSPDGTSAVTLNTVPNPDRYDETVDAVALIRCSNCHDVHNRNLADNDTMSGAPYLRGTWMGNPYPEDGAPQAGTVYTGVTYTTTNPYATSPGGFGAVPRGGVDYNAVGGYFIDENSGYPTKGWTFESSAGLCILCHGGDADVLDQTTGENLWLGANGHSNSALGGTGVSAVNIFDYTHGRPAPDATPAILETESYTNRIPDMANQYAAAVVGDMYFTYGYRDASNGGNPSTHNTAGEHLDVVHYNWGATVDAGTVDKNYHQFSCSKCHNPHASRLPKLMITNCLDVRHNTWDDDKMTQTVSTASTVDSGKQVAYFNSAQNCHRYDGARATELEKGGWNKVTPW